MKRQFPGNANNNQRCDPRFSGGRGPPHPRGQIHGRGGGSGIPQMNGRGGPINNFPQQQRQQTMRGGPPSGIMGRMPSQQMFGRGYHRNQMPPPQNNNNNNSNNFMMTNRNGPHGGLPTMRGGPPSGIMGRMPSQQMFGRGYAHRNQMPPPPPPQHNSNNNSNNFMMTKRNGPHPPPPPPPPPPVWQGGQLAGSGNRISHHTPNGQQLQQPQHISQQQQQQRYQQQAPPTASNLMPVPIPYQHQQQQLQLQQQQQQLSVTPNNNNYTGYQQAVLRVANTSNLTNQSHDQQQQFQSANTAMLKNNIQLRLQQQQLLHQKQAPAATTTMTQSSISVPPVTNNITKTPTVQEVDEAWKEYTAPGEGGVKYYHNELLKESTYHKPDVLKKKEQAINDPPPDSRKTSSPSQKRTWQEYEDSNTGKCYYSDGVSTTWEKPDGYVSPDTIVANTSLASEREERNNREPPSKKKKRSSTTTSSSSAGNIKDKTDNGDSFANKKEATAAFKGLLLAKAISPTLKWNEVLKVCESDSRWESLEEILSIGERKQALAEYQTKRINEIRNEQRRERVRAKEAFGQLLKDVLPSVSGFSARTSRFIDVRNSLSKDDRFYAVEDEATRESLFLDFCDEYKKREERNKRNKKREAQESFESFLQEREEGGTLTYASTWESFFVSLSEKDKADSRFMASLIISDSDRQLYFADFVIDLQKAEDDKRRRIRDAKIRAEKAQRDNYRELLHQMAVDGKIFPSSRWREIEGLLLKDDSFKMVEGQDRDAPRELFEKFVDEWDLMYRRERSFLCRLLRPTGKPDVVISTGTTYGSFKNSITNESSYSSEIQNETFRIINKDDPVSSARLLYDELVARTVDNKRNGGGTSSRRGSTRDDSSEDEGEIIEDGELKDEDGGELQ
jgi:pre-mRNA-processing factor 40